MAMYVSELNTGKLTFDGVKIKGALGGLGSDTIELVPDVDLYASDQYLVIDPTASDHVHIRAGGDIDNSDATLILGGEKSNITIDDQADAHVSILSRTADNSTSHVWKFNNDGTTSLPSLSVDLHTGGPIAVETLKFSDNSKNSVITGPTPAASTAAKPLIIQGQKQTGAAGGGVYLWGGDSNTAGGNIEILAGDNDGISGTAGLVTIRGGVGATGGSGGNVAITGGGGSTHGEVTITSNSNTWQFNNDGSTNFPAITTSLLGVSTSVEALMFGDNTLKSVITGPVPAATTAVKAIIVQGQDQTGAAGGDVCLYGGNSNRNAGDINITAGTSTGASYDAGTVTLRGGSNTASTGGNVRLEGGVGSGLTTHGEVTITSSSHEWTFENNGNLTIPPKKDILDGNGNTVVSGGNRVKNYVSSAGASIPVDEDNIYSINTAANSTNLVLPIGSTVPIGYELTVLDVYGNAATKNITVTAGSGDVIISAPSGIAIDTNFGLLAFKFIGGKNWIILYGR